MMRKLTAGVPAVIVGASLLATGILAGGDAGATTTPRRAAATKECQIKFLVKGSDGETHANITYSYDFDSISGSKSSKDVKLPFTLTTRKAACNYGLSSLLDANNHSNGAGHTYAYIYENGSLVAEGFAYGDSSYASALYSLNS